MENKKIIRVVVDEQTHAVFKEAAKLSSLPISTYIRMIAFQEASKPKNTEAVNES